MCTWSENWVLSGTHMDFEVEMESFCVFFLQYIFVIFGSNWTIQVYIVCDMWHMTCDMWHKGGGEHSLIWYGNDGIYVIF